MVLRRLSLLVACGAIALAAGALPAAASVLAAVDAPPPIRLLAPAAETPLVAGGEAEIAWEPLAAFATLGEVEEWEAFLSLDGGATYPFRLTPHLDQDVRRFRWRVPAVAATGARLLFRFGDEHREVPVAVQQRFVIEAPAVPTPFEDDALDIGRQSAHQAGESALPGQRGVVAWVEGTRRGGRVRQVVGSSLAGFAPAQVVPESSRGTAVEGSDGGSRDAMPPRVATSEQPLTTGSGDTAALAPPRPCDILLLTQRQNE
jgi:hypothetical protein